MATYLDRILASHRAAATTDDRPLAGLVTAARDRPPARGFRAALTGPDLGVIAEIKRRSPSKGDLAPDLDAGVLAKAYQVGRAACLSVLTHSEYFGGSVDDLVEAAAAAALPVLRKDFTVGPNDLCDAPLIG